MKTIFNIMDESIKDLNKVLDSFKKPVYDETIELIEVNEAFLSEYKARLKEIETLPYYKKFAPAGEKQKDINFCLDSINETKQDLKNLYKKLSVICTQKIDKI